MLPGPFGAPAMAMDSPAAQFKPQGKIPQWPCCQVLKKGKVAETKSRTCLRGFREAGWLGSNPTFVAARAARRASLQCKAIFAILGLTPISVQGCDLVL
jgi:hypothetical protein